MKNKKEVENEVSITDASHPYCQTAIHIIEEVIEPLLATRGDEYGLEGEEYYKTESDIITLLDKYLKK